MALKDNSRRQVNADVVKTTRPDDHNSDSKARLARSSRDGAGRSLAILLRKNLLLKRRMWRGTLCEFLIPFMFVLGFSLLKGTTDNVRVEAGWSLENRLECAYNVAPDGFGKTCSYPYTYFLKEVTNLAVIASSLEGTWVGHETAKLCLATSSGAAREREALERFVYWVSTDAIDATRQPNFSELVYFYGDGSVEELNRYLSSERYGNPVFTVDNPECAAALVFDSIDFHTAQYEYTLRLNSTNTAERFETARIYSATRDIQRRLRWGHDNSNPKYALAGFITFQTLVDAFLINQTGGNGTNYIGEEQFPFSNLNTTDSNIDMSVFEPYGGRIMPFPVKEYQWDEFFTYVALVFPLVFILCYLFPVGIIFENLVREKETRMTEMLKMMGVAEYLIVASWYVTYAAFFFLLALIITGMSTLFLPASASAPGGPVVVFLVYWLFGLATLAFCFALSTLFWKARTASFVGVILFLMGFFFYYLAAPIDVNPKPPILLLLPQVSFALLMQTVAAMEASGVGAAPRTLSEPVLGFTLAQGLLYLVLDFFLWSGLGFYLNAVLPREFGQRQPFYFLVSPWYWKRKLCGCDEPDPAAAEVDAAVNVEEGTSNPDIEQVDAALRQQKAQGRGIQIRNMSKTFSTASGPKTAVNDLSLDVFEGQVLALLGHNGAGKTTVINMLSGMLPISEGNAVVNGTSILTGMSDIRKDLGFCPQHDVLYAKLTVKEHLWFYGSIKGLSGSALQEAINKSVAEVGLTEKIDVHAAALSGGQKRKLSLANALIGGSKILFVDEPTSGVDPFSRRSIWQVLQNNREGRITVLTTHFMDEADLLGDRIAIMAEGELRCCGSSLFLKNKFGAGYVLTMVKQPGCDTGLVRRLVKSHVSSARLQSNVGSEISFQLPEADVDKFSALFNDLDGGLSELKLDHYGLSSTTLEEVFLKVARADDSKGGTEAGRLSSASTKQEKVDSFSFDEQVNSKLNQGKEMPSANTASMSALSLFWLHFRAMMLKRAQYSRRDARSFFCSVVMPLILYTCGLLVINFIPVGQDDRPFVLDFAEHNPDFPDQERAYMPVVEFAYDDATPVERVTSPAFFGDINLESPLENFTFDAADATVKRIFNHDYIGGVPTASELEKCGDECPIPPALFGAAALDMAQHMLVDDNPKSRKGAALHAAVIIQPRVAERPHSCLLADPHLDLLSGNLFLKYNEQACTDPKSACTFIETVFQGGTVCLPTGCLSNAFLGGAINDTLTFMSGGGSTSAGLLSPTEFEELVDNTLVMTCVGTLCNTGPSNLFEVNVCRARPTDCIVDGLTAFNVNATTLDLFVKPGKRYCDGRKEEDATAAAEQAFGGGGAPVPDSLGAAGPRQCMVSDIPQELARSFANILLRSFGFNATDAGGLPVLPDVSSLSESFDTGTLACLNAAQCTFSRIDVDVCIVNSCMSDTALGAETASGLEILVPELNSATTGNCASIPTECNRTFDLASFSELGFDPLTSRGPALALLFPDGLNSSEVVQLVADQVNNTTVGADARLSLLLATQLVISNAGDDFNATELSVILGASESIIEQQLAPLLSNTTTDSALLASLLSGGDFLGSINSTDLLQDPALIAGLKQLSAAGNTARVCSNPLDSCAQAEVDILGQILCVPTGCADDFTQTEYAYVTTLSQQQDWEQVPFFECNSTACNYGCRAGGNCYATDMYAARLVATNNSFLPSTGYCPELVVRYTYMAMINSTSSHGAPIVASQVHNALLRAKLKEMYPASTWTQATMPRILAKSQPMPLTYGLKTYINGILATVAAIFALLSFAFIPASVASYVVQERDSNRNVKHQQMVSGASIWSYWLSFYVFDMLLYLVPFAGALGLIQIFHIESYIDGGAFFGVALLFFGFGLSAIPFAYLTSNLFTVHTTALIGTLFINLLTGLILMIASFVMANLDSPSANEFDTIAKAFYRIFPGFCLGDALQNLSTLKVLRGVVGPGFEVPDPLDWDVIGADVFMLYITAAVYFALTMLVEYVKSKPKLFKALRPDHDIPESAPTGIDEDVQTEADRVDAGGADSEPIKIDHIRKVYRSAGGGKKVAVRDFSLGIPQGECFGLLGANGAGKTTTFKQLTGEVVPTKGTAYLGGLDILSEQRQVRQLTGYCPQFDALLPLLSVREHLQLFGRIKGITGSKLELAVTDLLEKLTLTPFEHKLAKTLSGGNKRKLSLGIAVIGAPSIILLDEFSTGMDIVSKRFMWDVIAKLCSGKLTGRKVTVVLTTHSMEECEALCNRLCIMVSGQMRCLGSVQHLKNRFTNGLLVDIKLKVPQLGNMQQIVEENNLPATITKSDLSGVGAALGNNTRTSTILSDDSAWVVANHLESEGSIAIEAFLEWWLLEDAFDKVEAFLDEHFAAGHTLVERHESFLKYTLQEKNLARVFNLLEGNKAELDCDTYSVTQPDLETIFNTLVAQQDQGLNKVRGMFKS